MASDIVMVCGPRVDVEADRLPEATPAAGAPGPGTLDDLVTILPPHLSLRRSDEPVSREIPSGRDTADIVGAADLAEDIDGRMLIRNPAPAPATDPPVFALHGFEPVECAADVGEWMERELGRDTDRVRHWFRPYRRHAVAIAESTSGPRPDPDVLDEWVSNLVEGGTAMLLARIENAEHEWGSRELHLLAHDAVLAVQTVPGPRSGRSTLRFTLPLGADAKTVATAALGALPDALSRWSKLAARLGSTRPASICARVGAMAFSDGIVRAAVAVRATATTRALLPDAQRPSHGEGRGVRGEPDSTATDGWTGVARQAIRARAAGQQDRIRLEAGTFVAHGGRGINSSAAGCEAFHDRNILAALVRDSDPDWFD